MHLMDLAAEVKAGVEDANMVGFRFNTVGVSDAISMGTDGMSFSLQSRDLIADSIETGRLQDMIKSLDNTLSGSCRSNSCTRWQPWKATPRLHWTPSEEIVALAHQI